MNAPFILAQATIGSAAGSTQRVMKIAKPQGEQAISLRLDNTARLDLSDIGNEKVTFVHVGDRLVILFDNQATVTIAGFFDDNGKPFQNLNIEVEGGRVIVGSEFATLFPISDDASVLPAAGNVGAPNSGASFHDATVEGFGTRSALALLSGEDGNGAGGSLVEGLTNTVPRIGTIALGNADDEGLSEGNLNGPGDVPGEATKITVSLNVEFGQDLTGRTLAFAATQPGLAGLTSGGEAISLALTVIGGLPALVGYTGLDPANAANHVFTITLDTGPLSGEYTFTLLQPLDHPIAGTEDTITLSIDFVATDGNGDFANGTFQVAVNDDSPVAGPVTTGLASEDSPLQAAINNASLEISWGADRSNTSPGAGLGDRSVGFTQTDPAQAGDNVTVTGTSAFAGPLTSNGDAVLYAFIGGVLVGYTDPLLGGPLAGLADPRIVFTVSLSDTGPTDKGSYSFELRQPLDHPAPDGTQHYIDLTIHFTAVDSDGDPIDGSFKVEIDANGVIVDAGATIDYSTLTEGVFINLANSTQVGPGVFPGVQFVEANTATDHDGAAVKVIGIDRLGTLIVNATGGSGDDVIIGGQEANILRGQDGDDAMRGMGGDDTLEGGKGDDFLRGDGGNDTLRGGDDNDQLVGNRGDDKLYGDAGNDLLDGGRGNDELHGGLDDDDLYGGRGADTLYGDEGKDLLYGGRGDDLLFGGQGNDVLRGDRGDDVLYGDEGADRLYGGRGNDHLYGSTGDDMLDGGRGDDTLDGGRGDDLLLGGRGDDTLHGRRGSDVLAGEEGDDSLFGGADRDLLIYQFGWDHDVFVGGEAGDDYDTALITGSFGHDDLTITLTGSESFTANFAATPGVEVTASEIERILAIDIPFDFQNDHLVIEGSGGADHIVLTSNIFQEAVADETVIASVGYDNIRIEGKGDNDIIDASNYFFGGLVLRGNGGDDQIIGSIQGDDIRGGKGDDALSGGFGNDLFTYDVGDGQDTVQGGFGNDLQEIYGTSTSETYNVNAITLAGQQFVGINILNGITPAQDVDATSSNYEVATRNVEDIYIETGVGADKVVVSGSLGGTGLATSTITIEDGNGNSGDTVDARGLTSNHSIEFIGHGGDDTFFVSGASGNDTFIGGNGTDTIDFSDVDHGIAIDLGNTSAQNTGDGFDTVDGVEDAVGSNFADRLTGNDDANVLTGLDGADTIKGGLGADTIDGGAGIDTAVYGEARGAPTFAFDGTHWTVTIGGETDTLIGVERVQFGNGKTFLLVDGAGENVGGYQTIQAAVDGATGGETVLIAPGTYGEQVQIEGSGKDGLTLQALTAHTVRVTGPAVLAKTADSPTSGRDLVSLIEVDGADNVTIDGIKVDGQHRAGDIAAAPDNGTLVGIAYLNSDGGVIDNVTVTGIRESDAQFGNQRGVGIYVLNTNPSPALPNTPTDAELAGLNSIEIKNSTVEDFQKTGIVAVYADVNIHDNVVTGYGATPNQAQNGIQVSDSTGTVANNTVTEIGYTGAGWASTGILTFENVNLVIDGNTVTGTGSTHLTIGVGVFDSRGVSVTNNDFSALQWAIDVEDYPTGLGWPDALLPGGGTVFVGNTFADIGDTFLYFNPDATTTQAFFVGGTSGYDAIYGAAGNDTLLGRGGDDYLEGRAGDDNIDGGEGDDTILYAAGEGADIIDGGEGAETVGDTLVVTATANADYIRIGSNLDGDAHLDIDIDANSTVEVPADGIELDVTNVEEIVVNTGDGADTVVISGDLAGAGVATSTVTLKLGGGNDTVIIAPTQGTPVHLAIDGGEGNDTFKSGAGNDTFIGGNGTDTVDFSGVSHGITVDLGNTSAQNTGDGDDTFSGVENAVGSNLNDRMTGNDDANVLTGLDGNDTIEGGLGNDTIGGGGGDDAFTYTVGDGVDTIEGGEGNEILGDKLVLTGTDGDQSITLKATVAGFNVDAGGAAGDEIVITNVERTVLNLGAGNDSLTVMGLNSGETITLVGNTISGTNLPTSTVTGAESVTIKGEDGNDTIDASRFGVAPTAGPGLAGPGGFGAFGNGWGRFAAQTFVATGEALSELTFGLTNLTGQVDFRVVIVAWDEANHKPLSTTPLYESGTLLYTTGGATNFTVAPGVTLTLGQTYAFVLDFKTDGETLQGNAYIPTYSDANGTQPGGLYFSTSGGGRDDALSNAWVASAAGNTDFAYQLTYAGHTVAGLTLDGGAGNDTIIGSVAADTIFGGTGDDTITGGKGNDALDGGEGDDTFNYAIGDGIDAIQGGEGFETAGDKLVVTGAANAQSLTLTATTSGFTLDTDGVAGAEITASNVEIATLNMAGGTDALTVAGLDTGETITLSGTAASFTVTGTNFPNTTVTNDEVITVNGNGGNDIIDASGLKPFVPVTAGTALGPQNNFLEGFGEGPGAIPYIAQTFVAKSDVLDQLSFTLGNSYGSDTVDFHVLIVAWDTINNHPVAGAPLYESTTLSAAAGIAGQTFNVTVAPHLALTPAKTYAIVVDAFVARDAINGYAEVPLVTGALAAERGGLFLISGDLATRDANFAVGWGGNSTVYDLAYQLLYQGAQTLGVTLNGGAGDDTITGSTGNDTIFGGADNDTINYVVGTGHDVVDGGSGNDKLNVTGANDAETYNVNAMTLNSQTYLGINILAGANNNVQATALNYEVATKAVEDIFITTNGGGDTVNVIGSLNGTGLATSTIHIDTGAGNDTIDLSGRTSGHRVVADGGADSDTVRLDFAYGALPISAYQKIFDTNGTTLIGVKITHVVDGVTVIDEFRNVENFEFTGGTKNLVELFNQTPVIKSATLIISEGGAIDSWMPNMVAMTISITDPDSSNFTYTVSEVTHGRFLHFNPDSWTNDYTTSFTSKEWAEGNVRFEHDGGEAPPTFNITASDGESSSATIAGTVTFTNVNDGPVVNSATLVISEGGTAAFAAGNLNVTDDGGGSDFAYTASGVTNGKFQVSDGVTWTDDTSFTTADIAANHVRFVHNGGEAAPAFSISASDGEASGAAKAGTVSFSNVNDAPFISAPAVQTINRNTDLVFDAAHGNRLTVGDPDTGDFNTVDILIHWTHGWVHNGGNGGDWFHGDALEYIGIKIGANLLFLNGFQFRPDANYTGDATLTFKVDDLGNTGTGGPLSASHTVTIHVTAPVALASSEGDLDAFAADSSYLDPLSGGVGNEVLHGGSESETLTGGAGNDTLTGGAGADTFKFAESGLADSDVITDYSAGEGDKLDLSSLLDAAFGTPGNTTVSDFVKLTFDGTNTKIEVDTNGTAGGANWSEVATLNNYNSISHQVLVEFENAVHVLNAA